MPSMAQLIRQDERVMITLPNLENRPVKRGDLVILDTLGDLAGFRLYRGEGKSWLALIREPLFIVASKTIGHGERGIVLRQGTVPTDDELAAILESDN